MENCDLKERFNQRFGDGNAEIRCFHAPGRVNLIGEHTDYNGGHVFPCALNLGTYGAARKRDDGLILLASGNIGPEVTVSVSDIRYEPAHGWANYPKAVVSVLNGAGFVTGGFDLYIEGDLPNGAGLSSSASVLLLTCTALERLFTLEIDAIEKVRLCQRAENEFIGLNCGIMDQFAVGMGRKDHAILLDCTTLQYTQVPLVLKDCRLIIANTNKQRGLTDSKYNERRAECDRALLALQQACDIDIKGLCELTPEQLENYVSFIDDPVVANRARHAVYENARTLAAVNLLNAGDLRAFGQLMNESHVSLRDLYEVTGPELDALAESAWAAKGVLGSRMTGAGFGGCTISIVQADAVDGFIRSVGAAYTARTGLTADFYEAETGEGAREL